jgi:L-lactate dehydrogenase (cytochrome)
MSIGRCNNVTDFRRIARRKLPAPMFHYIDGAADDERTLARNTAAFDDYELLPRSLIDVTTVDTRTRALGVDLEWPVILSPTGGTRLFHHEKELAVARAAAATGTLYSLSTAGTASVEEVAGAADGPKMYQLYMYKDRSLSAELVARCKAAGYDALCLTVDTAQTGYRERDIVYGLTMPPKFGLSSLASFALHPEWTLNFLLDPQFGFPNVASHAGPGTPFPTTIHYMGLQQDRAVTWKDVEWLRSLWDGPFLIKGVMCAEDARTAKAAGADGVIISNHGGRQLEGTPAAFDCIAPIREAVGEGFDLICDGGVRRGTHVLKALAMGANACSIGRPYLWALAAGGQKGVERSLRLLRAEVERDMLLLGARSVAEIDRSVLAQRGRPLAPRAPERATRAAAQKKAAPNGAAVR